MITLLCFLYTQPICAVEAKFTRGSFCEKIASTLQSRNPIIDASAVDSPFEDLNADEDYYEAVLWMTSMGYMKGYEDGTFKPYNSITRAEVAKILTTMLYGKDFEIPDNAEYDLDYNSNTWYAKYAWKAKSCGLMNSENNLFKGDDAAKEKDINYNVIKEYATFDEITILIDGEQLSLANYNLPILKNETVMAPLRQFCEALGTTVSWNNNTQTVIIKKNNKTMTLQIDNEVMYIDGKSINLDASPCIVQARTYVPARAIAEGFDAQVYWYSDINTMIIKNGLINDEENTEESVDYKINSVTIKDMSGNNLQAIPTGTFLATVSFTNVSSSADTVIILAQYADAGAFKGLMYIQTEDVPIGSTIKLSIPVDNSKGDIAKLKAFCWESSSSLTPMGNSASFPTE